jgi:mRNA interferase MazF
VTYERFDVVVVPFPFTDKAQVKRRPALLISNRTFGSASGHSVMVMITSAGNPPWPSDVVISDLAGAGLPAPSVVRMKLFTLDHRLIVAKCGSLSRKDQGAVGRGLKEMLRLQAKAH